MKAQSKVYIQLQNIYKTKARQDVAEVLEIVRASQGGEIVDSEEVELFCKNAAFVKLINVGGAEPDRLTKVTSMLDPPSDPVTNHVLTGPHSGTTGIGCHGRDDHDASLAHSDLPRPVRHISQPTSQIRGDSEDYRQSCPGRRRK